MTNQSLHKPLLFLAGSLLIALSLLLWLQNHIGVQYQKLVNDPRVLAAVSSPDPNLAASQLGPDYGLQKFEGSAITYSSQSDLPKPQITAFYQLAGAGVLPTSTQSNLQLMQPYRQFINGHLFLVVPIISDPAQKFGYLVYTRLLL